MTSAEEMAHAAAEGIAKKILTAWFELRLTMRHGDATQADEARKLYRCGPQILEANWSEALSTAFQKERGTRLYRIVAEEPGLQRMLSGGELWEIPPGHVDVVLKRIQSLPQELEQALAESFQG